MTPDELRALADAATRDPRWWQGDEEARPGFAQLEAGNRLIALAPYLARLCAELGEALEQLERDLDLLKGALPDAMRETARAARAKLVELECAELLTEKAEWERMERYRLSGLPGDVGVGGL